MGAFVATTTSNVQLDWLTGRATPAAAAARYISVWNGDPQGAGSEVTSTVMGSATRITLTTTSMNAASAGSAVSNATVTLTTSCSGVATVTYVGIHSASTGASNLMASAAVTSKSLSTGDSLSIPSGSLSFSIT